MTVKSFRFVVYAPPHFVRSAGVWALHKLANDLRQLGFQVYLCLSFSTKRHTRQEHNPYLIQELTQDQILEFNRQRSISIAIYPEGTSGNSLGADYSIMWVLGTHLESIDTEGIDQVVPYSELIGRRYDLTDEPLFFPALFLSREQISELRRLRDRQMDFKFVSFYAGKSKTYTKEADLPAELIGAQKVEFLFRDGPNALQRKEMLERVARSKFLIMAESSAVMLEAIAIGTPVVLIRGGQFMEFIGEQELGNFGVNWWPDSMALGNLDPDEFDRHLSGLERKFQKRLMEIISQAKSRNLDFESRLVLPRRKWSELLWFVYFQNLSIGPFMLRLYKKLRRLA